MRIKHTANYLQIGTLNLYNSNFSVYNYNFTCTSGVPYNHLPSIYLPQLVYRASRLKCVRCEFESPLSAAFSLKKVVSGLVLCFACVALSVFPSECLSVHVQCVYIIMCSHLSYVYHIADWSSGKTIHHYVAIYT